MFLLFSSCNVLFFSLYFPSFFFSLFSGLFFFFSTVFFPVFTFCSLSASYTEYNAYIFSFWDFLSIIIIIRIIKIITIVVDLLSSAFLHFFRSREIIWPPDWIGKWEKKKKNSKKEVNRERWGFQLSYSAPLSMYVSLSTSVLYMRSYKCLYFVYAKYAYIFVVSAAACHILICADVSFID